MIPTTHTVPAKCPVCRSANVDVSLSRGDFPEDPNRVELDDYDAHSCSCHDSALVDHNEYADRLFQAALDNL